MHTASDEETGDFDTDSDTDTDSDSDTKNKTVATRNINKLP